MKAMLANGHDQNEPALFSVVPLFSFFAFVHTL